MFVSTVWWRMVCISAAETITRKTSQVLDGYGIAVTSQNEHHLD